MLDKRGLHVRAPNGYAKFYSTEGARRLNFQASGGRECVIACGGPARLAAAIFPVNELNSTAPEERGGSTSKRAAVAIV